MGIKWFQKLLSYLFPVRIWKGSGTQHTVLELFLYNGQWQLATEDAVYSDGIRYRPLLLAFRKLREELPFAQKVLFLGTGLGSGVKILRQMGFSPHVTMVDNDQTILGLAEKLLADPAIHFVKADAAEYIGRRHPSSWCMIVIDVFSGRIVPEFVTTPEFIQQCRERLTPGGIIVINFMLNTSEDYLRFSLLKARFPQGTDTIDIGINKVLIAKV